ncbi:cadmium-translocating P-type ATPase [bacterium]|nr:MAG: cadmium-translocating P-type ATPase [bacterium]
MKVISIPVKGMDCASCARTVEKVVKANPGIESVDVNVAAESAKISFDESAVAVKKLIESIENSGYQVPLQKTRFSVQDMDCASCVKSIETWVSALDGVTQVDVNFGAKWVTIEHDLNAITPLRLQKEIKDIGYTPVAEEDNKEQELVEQKIYRSYQQRLTIAIVATLPVFVVSMFMLEFPGHEWMQFLLSTVVVFGAGRGFFKSGYYSLKAGAPNMDVLVSIGASTAYFYSAIAVLFPQLFTDFGQEPHLYFETAATIVTLILTGNLLEKRATARTSDSLKKLIGLQPKTALVKRGEQFEEEEIELISVGEFIQVRPGERVPLDGKIVSGKSSVDQSMLTGESIPVDVLEGDTVLAGSINKAGSFVFKVEKANAETTLSRIIQLVKEANGTKAPIQRLADKVSAWFVPTVLGIALLTFIVWFFFVDVEFAFRYAIMTSVAVMIIACPCAMGLAAPTAVMVGIGRGAENGILIRGGEALEKLHEVDTIVLDKTGTITTGEIKVQSVITLNGVAEDELLRLAASAELPSEHPVGKSVVQFARKKGLELTQPLEFSSEPGVGVTAKIEDKIIRVKKLEKSPEQFKNNYGTSIQVLIDDKESAYIQLSDQIRSDSKDAIQRLQSFGLEVIMLTGDNDVTAQAIAKQAGITSVISNVLPHEKAAEIDKLAAQGKKVAMVGDGINDAPSLAKAHVGIAMGQGTDIALESSDVILQRESLSQISDAIGLSRQTVRTIKQNLFWAFFYNTAAIPVAAGVLYPGFGILLSPMIGAATMAFSDIFVIGNSILLKFKQLR